MREIFEEREIVLVGRPDRYTVAMRVNPGGLLLGIDQGTLDRQKMDYLRLSQDRLAALAIVRRAESVELGKTLAGVLLPGRMRDLLGEAIDGVIRKHRVLRLRLKIRPPFLRDLAWELLYLARPAEGGAGEFLGTNPYVSIFRHSRGPAAMPAGSTDSADGQAEAGGKIRVLLVWADACGRSANAAGGFEEVVSAYRGFGRALSDRVHLRVLGDDPAGSPAQRATADNVRSVLSQGRWHAVLFVCHGEKGGLLLEGDKAGVPSSLRGGELADLLRRAGAQIALFDACDSYGVARPVARYVPIVVANRFRVTVGSSLPFWRCFFQGVSEPVPIDLCVGGGRRFLENISSHLPDWSTPVLFRGRSTALAEPATESPRRPPYEYVPVEPPLEGKAWDQMMQRTAVWTPPVGGARTHMLRDRASSIKGSLADALCRKLDEIAAGLSSRPEPPQGDVPGRIEEIRSLGEGIDNQALPLAVALTGGPYESSLPPPISSGLGRDRNNDLWSSQDVPALLQGDPWYLLLLGEGDDPRPTSPIWLTSLRQSPAYLLWPRAPYGRGYRVEIDDGTSTRTVTLDRERNLLPLDREFAPGPMIWWTVRCIRDDGQLERWVHGRFSILGQAQQETPRQVEDRLGSLDDLDRAVARSRAYVRLGLYDDALRLLEFRAPAAVNPSESFFYHRELGGLYRSMYDRMSRDLRWIGPELMWAGSRNKLHMCLAYCAGLGRLDSYRNGTCSQCGRCPLGRAGGNAGAEKVTP